MKRSKECSEVKQTLRQKLAIIFSDRRQDLRLSYRDVERLGKYSGGGFNYQTMFKIEKGTLRLKPRVVKRLAAVLGLEIPKELIPQMEPISNGFKPTTTLGIFLRERRLGHEENQPKFAARIGISCFALNQLESGKRNARKSTLAKIKNALRVDNLPV